MRKLNLTKLRKHSRKCHEKAITKRKSSFLITVNETVNTKRRENTFSIGGIRRVSNVKFRSNIKIELKNKAVIALYSANIYTYSEKKQGDTAPQPLL